MQYRFFIITLFFLYSNTIFGSKRNEEADEIAALKIEQAKFNALKRAEAKTRKKLAEAKHKKAKIDAELARLAKQKSDAIKALESFEKTQAEQSTESANATSSSSSSAPSAHASSQKKPSKIKKPDNCTTKTTIKLDADLLAKLQEITIPKAPQANPQDIAAVTAAIAHNTVAPKATRLTSKQKRKSLRQPLQDAGKKKEEERQIRVLREKNVAQKVLHKWKRLLEKNKKKEFDLDQKAQLFKKRQFLRNLELLAAKNRKRRARQFQAVVNATNTATGFSKDINSPLFIASLSNLYNAAEILAQSYRSNKLLQNDKKTVEQLRKAHELLKLNNFQYPANAQTLNISTNPYLKKYNSLVTAVRANDAEKVNKLIERNPDILTQKNGILSPLYCALLQNSGSMVALLLSKNVPISASDLTVSNSPFTNRLISRAKALIKEKELHDETAKKTDKK